MTGINCSKNYHCLQLKDTHTQMDTKHIRKHLLKQIYPLKSHNDSHMSAVNIFHRTIEYDTLVKRYCNTGFNWKWSYYQVSNLGFQMASSLYIYL